jgi:hypothetical protein
MLPLLRILWSSEDVSDAQLISRVLLAIMSYADLKKRRRSDYAFHQEYRTRWLLPEMEN